MQRLIFVLPLIGLLTGCTVGPKYNRPDVPAPPQFRDDPAAAAQQSLGDAKWFDVFQDEKLRVLIKEALAANYDVRMAAQRIVQAEGRLASTRSALFPQFGAQGSANRQGVNQPVMTSAGLYGAASWEIDLFGRIRKSTEAANADLAALREDRSAILQSIVAQVAAAYFDLQDYDAELDYVNESVKTRNDSLRLVSARLEGGVANRLEYDQAKSLVAAAEAARAQLQQAIQQTENLISFLLGRNPGPIDRNKTLFAQAEPPAVPAGLPSALLDRRPDIRRAEQQLVSANARVGVAKAAFFPSIMLTGSGGYQSTDLAGAYGQTGSSFAFAGVVDLPIFDAGRRAGNYKTAKAAREELIIGYQKAIQNAFRDVSDSLIGFQKSKEYRASQQVFAETLRDQSRLSTLRYRGGVSSYLEVLDTERQRLAAEQELARAMRDELVSLVRLYVALGGGWQVQ